MRLLFKRYSIVQLGSFTKCHLQAQGSWNIIKAMKLSQPKSAREINTARVLGILKNTPDMSRAELSRVLGLNKVSTGEIVEDLISRGVIAEGEKLSVINGRRPTTLKLVTDFAVVLAVDIGISNFSVALCTLDGKIVKMERIPIPTDVSPEQYCVCLIKSCLRTIKLAEGKNLLGVGLTYSQEPFVSIEDIAESLEKSLQTEVAVSYLTTALVNAEASNSTLPESGLMYINWSETISLAVVFSKKVATVSNSFGDIKITEKKSLKECCCSQTRLSDLWESMDSLVLESLARGLRMANKVTGAGMVVIGGEGATIPEDKIRKLEELCPGMKIVRSGLGNQAVIRAAGDSALDRFFYRSSMLNEVADYI